MFASGEREKKFAASDRVAILVSFSIKGFFLSVVKIYNKVIKQFVTKC